MLTMQKHVNTVRLGGFRVASLALQRVSAHQTRINRLPRASGNGFGEFCNAVILHSVVFSTDPTLICLLYPIHEISQKKIVEM